jgi:hypothetical protein
MKSNMSVEIVSDKAEVYRISKGDLLYFFDPFTSKTIESLKGIDNTQQINMLIKLKYIETLTSMNDWSSIENLNFVESSPIVSSIPEYVRENHGLFVLRDSLKNLDTSGTAKKLEDLKTKLQPGKKDTTKVTKDTLNVLNTLSTSNNLLGANKDLSKNIAIGTQRLAPKTMNKLGLTESQLAAKSKLDALSSIKKTDITEDEVIAFKRINEKKKTQGIGINKLIAGLEPKAETLTFDELARKLNKDRKDEESLSKLDLQDKEKTNCQIENMEDSIKTLITKKESKDSVNIEKISQLDTEQLFKRTDSVKQRSDKGLGNIIQDN